MSQTKGLKLLFLVLVIGLVVAFFWERFPVIKDSVHAVLNPTVGTLLDINRQGGFILIVIIFSLVTTLLQKFTTDQDLLRSIKEEQKTLRADMKEFKDHPEKMMELNKKSMEIALKAMETTMRPALFTAIPFVLFFRWFGDYFTANPTTFFGFMSWLWAFILLSVISSMVLRKLFKLP